MSSSWRTSDSVVYSETDIKRGKVASSNFLALYLFVIAQMNGILAFWLTHKTQAQLSRNRQIIFQTERDRVCVGRNEHGDDDDVAVAIWTMNPTLHKINII